MNWIHEIGQHERTVFSQNGEDGVIEFIFDNIGTTDKFVVEFGCDGGTQCNARYLHEQKGWHYLLMDGGRWGSHIKHEFITRENINELFRKYKVPNEFDLLSVDIDGNDYWVCKALQGYKPRVICQDYNGLYKPPMSVTIEYDPAFVWNGNDYATASLEAFVRLNKTKGYTLVYCECRGVNAFFVRDDIVAGMDVPSPFELWRPLDIKPRLPNREATKRWVDITLSKDGNLQEKVLGNITEATGYSSDCLVPLR